MKLLDRFEQSIERVMEGSIARIFRSRIQPAEIGRKLERTMVEKQVVSVGSTLVPNDYRVTMHPRDMDAFADFVPALCRQMETWLTEVAARRGYTMVDHARIDIRGDEQVPRRAIQVAATIADRAPRAVRDSGAVQRTEIYRPVAARVATAPARLRLTSGPRSGQEFDLRRGMTTVGRAMDNDLVIDAGDVSRHHARIEVSDGQITVVDLNSTNGTRVNGARVHAQNLHVGDTITFGAVTGELLPPGT